MARVSGGRPVPVERANSIDLMELATDVGPVPMQVAAVLVLGGGPGLHLEAVRTALEERIRAVPRLRQRLVRVPPGCGRPVWVDDPGFDIRRHVHELRCPPPGDEPALLAAAARVATRRLPGGTPPWAAYLVSGLAAGRAALVVVVHHVLTDGIGGLAVLAKLVDGVPAAPGYGFPRPAPSRSRLFQDALAGRARAVAALPARLRLLRGAVAELRPGRIRRAPACSLNRPTGARRRLAVARADLDAIRQVAHAHGGTVNDVVLAAVAGAVHGLLRGRGETVGHLVVSVPVSARRQASAGRLGNQVGVIPVEVPAAGDPVDRLPAIVRASRARKAAPRGASAALLAPAFRFLARLGVLGRLIGRQRLVNTFVTNLPGPSHRLSFLGAPITEVIPVSGTTGNVTVAFAVLSYAGTLVVTLVADPDRCPDLPVLTVELQTQLDTLAASRTAVPGAGTPG